MNLGLSLGLSARGPLGIGINPTTLALTGLYLDYPGTTWPGTASAGTSGSRSLNNNAGTVLVGGQLNGHNYATYNGSSQRLFDSNVSLASYISVSAYTIGAIVRCRNPLAPQGSPFNDPGPLGDNSAIAAFRWTNQGIAFYQHDGARKSTPFIAATAATWLKIWARRNGGTLEVRVNGSAWSAFAGTVGDIPSITGSMFLVTGQGYAATGTSFCACDVAAVMTSQTALSDATVDGIDANLSARFGGI